MSARSWKYGEDARGRDLIEDLDARQGHADESVLRDFNMLEGRVFEGKTISDDYCKKIVSAIQERVEILPPQRQLHWINELERIGGVVKGAQPKPAAKPARKESTGGAK